LSSLPLERVHGRGRSRDASERFDPAPMSVHGQENARNVPAEGDEIRQLRAIALAETVSPGIELHPVSRQIALRDLHRASHNDIDSHDFSTHHAFAPIKVGRWWGLHATQGERAVSTFAGRAPCVPTAIQRSSLLSDYGRGCRGGISAHELPVVDDDGCRIAATTVGSDSELAARRQLNCAFELSFCPNSAALLRLFVL